MTTKKRLLTILLALVMCLCFVTGCGNKTVNNPQQGGNADALEPKYGGIIRVSMQANPTSLFTIYKKANAMGYTTQCTEILVGTDAITNELDPRLAVSWDEDKVNNTLTFHLREGVKFHDGSDFDAEAVKWNYEFYIENGQGGNIYNPKKIEVIDKYTIKFYFDSYHIDQVESVGDVYMYSKKAYDENGLDWCMLHPIGTGAFIFKEYVADNRIVYTRNDNYWGVDDRNGNKLPYADGYEVYIISDANSALAGFLNNEIDYLKAGTVAVAAAAEAGGFAECGMEYPGAYTMYWMLPNSNVEGDPWSNKLVRQAVMLYGINYDDLYALASNSTTGRKSFQPYTETSLFWDQGLEDEFVNCYDKEKALKMLADAGYPNGFDTTLYPLAAGKNFATALAGSLKELGINATIETINSNDPRRYDGVTPGVFFMNGTTTYDMLQKFFPTNMSATSKTFGKVINHTVETKMLYAAAANADSYETRSEEAKKLMRNFLVDECYGRCAYLLRGSVYLNPKLHNSALELNKIGGNGGWFEQ